MKHPFFLLSVFLVVLAGPISSTQVAADIFADNEALLPPTQKWSGKSEALMVSEDDPWITPAERTGLVATPGYEETMTWLHKLVAAAPELKMVSIGRSLQGRDFWMVIASADQAFTAEALNATGKPLLLAHSGIHAAKSTAKTPA